MPGYSLLSCPQLAPVAYTDCIYTRKRTCESCSCSDCMTGLLALGCWNLVHYSSFVSKEGMHNVVGNCLVLIMHHASSRTALASLHLSHATFGDCSGDSANASSCFSYLQQPAASPWCRETSEARSPGQSGKAYSIVVRRRMEAGNPMMKLYSKAMRGLGHHATEN